MRNLPWTDASISQMPVALREVVPLICVELVGAASRTAGEPRHTWNGIDPRFEHHRAMAIGAGHARRQGYAAPVYGEMAFAVELAAIRGIRPCLFACPRGARYRRAVDARPPPVDLVMLAQTLEQRQMQSLPNTVSLPVAQAAPACHTAAKAQFLW